MRILIIEDDRSNANLLLQLLADEHETRLATSEQDAVTIGRSWKPELIISDWDLKEGGNGVEACKEISKDLKVQVIITSGAPIATLAETAKLLKPWRLMSKPLELDELFTWVEIVKQQGRLD